jgi:hypothetical protein
MASPFRKATPARPAESASHSSSSGKALRQAAACACRSPRASVRQHHTLVARSVGHSGLSFLGRRLRVARSPRVMIISAAQRRPCSGNETSRIRSVSTRRPGRARRLWRYRCLSRADRDQSRGRDVDGSVRAGPQEQTSRSSGRSTFQGRAG